MRRFVGISCCIKSFGPNTLPNHAAPDACVHAAAELAGAVPVLVPALGDAADIPALLARLDGILLTGSRSMVCPAHYGGPPHQPHIPEDRARDGTTLPLIRAAIARGIPVLAICRGFQELNVALGGSLHQRLTDLPGRIDHAPTHDDPLERRFAKCHPVHLTSGGLLRHLAGDDTACVNSVHYQGVDRLAPGLTVEAVAPDGTIEAIRLAHGRGFAVGVQWHPETDWQSDTLSRRIFEVFGEALDGNYHAGNYDGAAAPAMPMAAD
jgi:putative glutamine amidotransferase